MRSPRMALARRAQGPAVGDTNSAADRVGGALAQLSNRHRSMIYRAYYLGRTTRQIAAELGIDDGVVKDELHRALRELRSHLHRADHRPVPQEDGTVIAFPGPASR